MDELSQDGTRILEAFRAAREVTTARPLRRAAAISIFDSLCPRPAACGPVAWLLFLIATDPKVRDNYGPPEEICDPSEEGNPKATFIRDFADYLAQSDRNVDPVNLAMLKDPGNIVIIAQCADKGNLEPAVRLISSEFLQYVKPTYPWAAPPAEEWAHRP